MELCKASECAHRGLPPLQHVLRKGAAVGENGAERRRPGVGTDNAMTALPDMVPEMEFAGRVLRSQGGNGWSRCSTWHSAEEG